VKYKVESELGGIVDGLGVFEPGTTREFSEADVKQFEAFRGVKLTNADLPEGFTVTIVVGEE
jgi:hypothetical protein